MKFCWERVLSKGMSHHLLSSLNLSGGGGGTWIAKGGIRLVHGHTKSTLIKYFSGMKIDPKYAFLHAFFLICPSCPFQKFDYMTKNTPFFPILHVFAPLNHVREYSAWSWENNPNYVNFWTSLIPPLTFEWPFGPVYQSYVLKKKHFSCQNNITFS